MGIHTWDPSTSEAEVEDREFKAGLSYIHSEFLAAENQDYKTLSQKQKETNQKLLKSSLKVTNSRRWTEFMLFKLQCFQPL